MKFMSKTGLTPVAAAIAAMAALFIDGAHAQTATPPAPPASAVPAAEPASAPAAAASASAPASAPVPATSPAAENGAPAAAAPAQAEAEAPRATGLSLDAIVVTGSSGRTSKMKSSVSISSIGAEQLERTKPTSSAEVLRSVPGVRAEASGGESNANVTVRGLPISAGGSRYVQFQEDGLPLLQFGDIAFATPDTFMRVDSSLDKLEVVRGGSSSTLATNAPGGIVNFISKTGREKGGSFGLTKGLDYDQTRYDFSYGSPIGPKTRFFLGGHYRHGEGARETGGANLENGGQLRGNITQELDNGYVRLNFKMLEDRAPTMLPVPVIYNSNGTISERPGFDPRRGSFYSPYWLPDLVLTRDNGRLATNVNDGMTVKSNSVGLEGEFDLADGWKLAERFRTTKNTGRFIGVLPGDVPSDVTTTYASGPMAGQPYVGPALTAVVFNTSLDDMSLTANDLRLSKTFDLDSNGKLSTTAGLYTSVQKLDVTWNFNQYLVEATGSKPALLTSVNNGTPGLGGCCMNTQESEYTTTAPYGVLGWEQGPVNLEASVRLDRQKASGTYNRLAFNTAPGATTYDLSRARTIDYSVKHTSYSLGGNYRLNPDLALFSRYSNGVAFNADRITFFNDARLTNGTLDAPINTVRQLEAGTKWRQGALNTFFTLFWAKTDESNFDFTTVTPSPTTRKFDAKGAEVEASYRMGAFNLAGGFTYTDAKLVSSSDATDRVGEAPKRQAKVVYQLTPSYSVGRFVLGGSVIGTTGSRDDGTAAVGGKLAIKLPGYTVVNAFASYQFTPSTVLSLSANNLFDKIGYTESNDGRDAARSINGRTVQASLKYSF